MKKHLVLFSLAAFLCASLGCSTPVSKKLNRLDLGMTPAQVKKILGSDYIVKAATTDSSGSRLQMWEYTDKKTQEPYHIYFKDDQLARWDAHGKSDFPELNLPK